MSKKISGAEYPLAKIFSSDFDYTIPSYQRPYAWGVDQSSELFDDLYDFFLKEQEETYFLGSIVLIKDEATPPAEVIDGQQRLTTLTILIASIASRLPVEQKTQFLKYLMEPGSEFEGLAPKPRLSLRERDREFFARYVQGLKFPELLAINAATLGNESQKNIQANSRLLHDRLQKYCSDEGTLKGFAKFLVQRCFLVAVSTPSQKSAFRVFSVLNNRGLDLLPTDIIKADIIGKVPEASQDEYTERWEDLEVQTGRDGFNELFGHIRMIHGKEKAKRALLEEFREQVISKIKTSQELVDNVLQPFAEAFLIVKNQQYVSTKNAHDTNRLIEWLNRIDNSDWIPPAISFLSQKKDDADYVLWFFQKLERLAAHLHVCAKNVNQRIDRYAEILQELEGEHSLEAPLTSIELSGVEKAEMKAALDSHIYELTPRRRNYLILRLDSFLSDGAASYNPSLLTIEHVLPQTVSPGSAWLTSWPDEDLRKAWVHRIANLVPLTQKRNSQAQNYDFATKKTAYFGGSKGVSSYVLTTQVLNTPDWTPAVIQVRQTALLKTLAESWELD